MPRSQKIPPQTRDTAAENKRRLEAEAAARKAQIQREVREGTRNAVMPTGRRNPNKDEVERKRIEAFNRSQAAKAKQSRTTKKGF